MEEEQQMEKLFQVLEAKLQMAREQRLEKNKKCLALQRRQEKSKKPISQEGASHRWLEQSLARKQEEGRTIAEFLARNEEETKMMEKCRQDWIAKMQ